MALSKQEQRQQIAQQRARFLREIEWRTKNGDTRDENDKRDAELYSNGEITEERLKRRQRYRRQSQATNRKRIALCQRELESLAEQERALNESHKLPGHTPEPVAIAPRGVVEDSPWCQLPPPPRRTVEKLKGLK